MISKPINGVTMRQAPFGAVAAIDQCNAQRPFLRRQAANLDSAALDDRQHHHVVRCVALNDFLRECAVPEEPPHPLPRLAGHVPTMRRCSAERRHEREVIGVADQRPITIDVAAHQHRIRGE